jgi:hypothetical protein
MMTIGLFMILLSFLFLLATRKQYEDAKWMKWVPWVIPLPYMANTGGWVLTEMGRQPWIVHGLLTVDKAVSPNLTPLDLLISLLGYTVVYGSLASAMFYLMKKFATAGPDATLHESVDVEPEGGIGDALPQRPGRRLDARSLVGLGMPGRPAAPLPEGLQIVQAQVVAGQVEEAVEQHAAVSGRQHESVAVRPVRVTRGCR